MSTLLQCPTCGGTYPDVDRQGARYAHVCPPLSLVELKAAITAGAFQPSDATRARLEAAALADRTDPPPADGISHVDRVLGALTVARVAHRDENDPDTPAPRPAPIDAGGDFVVIRKP